MTDEKGHVLKMVDMSQPTGVAETSFFEKVFNQKQKNKDLENLKKFLPQYFGLLQITVNGEKRILETCLLNMSLFVKLIFL